MSKSGRRGFTLLEVALAAVMGLVIVAGAYYGYVVNKEQAGNATAHRRLVAAQGTIEAYAAAHSGQFPSSGQAIFAQAWAAAHPEERGVSPWGGPSGNEQLGACEDPPISDGGPDAGSAVDKTDWLPTNAARQGNLHYVSIERNGYVSVTTRYHGQSKVLRSYILSIYDGTGRPWFDAIGGK